MNRSCPSHEGFVLYGPAVISPFRPRTRPVARSRSRPGQYDPTGVASTVPTGNRFLRRKGFTSTAIGRTSPIHSAAATVLHTARRSPPSIAWRSTSLSTSARRGWPGSSLVQATRTHWPSKAAPSSAGRHAPFWLAVSIKPSRDLDQAMVGIRASAESAGARLARTVQLQGVRGRHRLGEPVQAVSGHLRTRHPRGRIHAHAAHSQRECGERDRA